MMNNKSIIAIAIVAVIIVAGAGVYLVLGNNGSEKVDPADETTRLNICGNANLDNYLDDKDIQYIQDIIDGKEAKTILADANNDGKIDQKDIDQVKALMNFTAQSRWYLDINDKIACVKGDINSVAIQYWPTLQAFMAVGAEDLIKYADTGALSTANSGQYGQRIANMGIQSFGSGFHSSYDFETMLAIGVDAIVCGSAEIYFIGIEDRFTPGTEINMIRLPFWEKANVASSYITLAYLLNDKDYVDQAYEYLDFVTEIQDLINERTKNVEQKTVLVNYYSAGSSALEVEVECRGSGSYECSTIANLYNLASDIPGGLSSSTMYYQTDVEYIMSKDPDYILMLHGSGLAKTEADQKTAFDKWTAYLKDTTAYKNHGIMVSGSGLMSGLFQTNLALLIACQVYADEFKDIDGYDYLQEMIDRFTPINEGKTPGSAGYFDVTKNGAYLYVG